MFAFERLMFAFRLTFKFSPFVADAKNTDCSRNAADKNRYREDNRGEFAGALLELWREVGGDAELCELDDGQ